MRERYSTTAAGACAELLRPGAYLTDGRALFSVVGELPEEPALCVLEDCSTLEMLVVHVEDLREPRVREVHAST